jgi:RNA polymerase sigma factor (sigma-70 family)
MKSRLADPVLRREVEMAVRRRVRGDEAEDVVQATLADVLAASSVPDEPEEFRRYVFGVARHKVFDHFRRQKRKEEGLDERDPHAPHAPEAPLSARDILRWAEGELPDSEDQSTLEWMLREGDGEKLEHIARDARLPATRVRKRVSRLRKLLRERWAAELLLIGGLLLLAGLGLLYLLARGKTSDDVVKREPVRPAPSSLQAPQAPRVSPAPQTPPESRPAGSSSAIPNSVAPPPRARPQSTEMAPSKVAPVPLAKPSPPAQPTPQTKSLSTPTPESKPSESEVLDLPVPSKESAGSKPSKKKRADLGSDLDLIDGMTK